MTISATPLMCQHVQYKSVHPNPLLPSPPLLIPLLNKCACLVGMLYWSDRATLTWVLMEAVADPPSLYSILLYFKPLRFTAPPVSTVEVRAVLSALLSIHHLSIITLTALVVSSFIQQFLVRSGFNCILILYFLYFFVAQLLRFPSTVQMVYVS